MPDNNKTQIDRLTLEQQLGRYMPPSGPSAIPNIPFRDLQTGGGGGGFAEEEVGRSLDDFQRAMLSPSGDGRLTGGGIERSLFDASSNRFNNYLPGDNNEDAYAQGQSWAAKMVNGLGKGGVLMATTFASTTIGTVYGLYKWMQDGKFSSFYNNQFTKDLDEANKRMEDVLPNYYTEAERNASWYAPSKLFSANFLWDGIVKNLGFAAGAVLAGGVYATGIKAISALPGLSRLISVGKQAEALALSEKIAASGKAVESFGKLKSLSTEFLSNYKVLSPGGRAVVAGLATSGEASIEAYHNMNEFRNQKIEEYKATHAGELPRGAELDEINDMSALVGNRSYLLNTALLSATNYIQFPKILGSSYTAEKGILSNVVRKTGRIIEEDGKYIAASTKGGKMLGQLNKIRPYTFNVVEGFEEGAQYAISVGTKDYYDKRLNGEGTSFLNSLMAGVRGTLGTDEGMENILIGGLSGSIMTGRGRYIESVQKRKNTEDAITQFNKHRLSDFTKDTFDSINRAAVLQEEKDGAVKNGDVLETKDIEADYVINYLSPRIKYGRYDLVRSEIEDYRALASTEDGFQQLIDEGKALPTDTRESFLNRISQLEKTADNVKNLYQSLNVRYGAKLDEKGRPLYSPDVIDKMVYAASKIADYDERIPSLMAKFTNSELIAAGVNIVDVVNDVAEGKTEKFNEAVTKIKSINAINKDELAETLEDVSELTLRRQKFVKEYEEMKEAPSKFKEVEIEDKPLKSEQPTNEEGIQTVKVKTKRGEKELTVGEEYMVGRRVRYDKDGNEVYEAPIVTILGENEDGTIKVRNNITGQINDVSKSTFEKYALTKFKDVQNNKKAMFFHKNWNVVYKHWGLKDRNGKPREGRIEYSNEDGVLMFTFKDEKGKVRSYPVKRTQFVAQENFPHAMLEPVKTLSIEQQRVTDEMTAEKEAEYSSKDVDETRKILSELHDELTEEQKKIEELLAQKQEKLKRTVEGLELLREDIESGELMDKRKTFGFKRTAKPYVKATLALTKDKEQLEGELATLETRKEDLEFTRAYIDDILQNIGELPIGTEAIIAELTDHLDLLKDAIVENSKQISALHSLIESLEKAIQSAIDFLLDVVGEFENKFSKVPRDVESQEWIDFLKANPNFLKVSYVITQEGKRIDIKRDYLQELKDLNTLVAEVEDVEIKLNEEKAEKARIDIIAYQKKLDDAKSEFVAISEILDRFEAIKKKYDRQIEEEQRLQKNEKLIKESLGTAYKDVQTVPSDDDYEATAKKATHIIPVATMGIDRGKAHQERANAFGANLESLPNRDDVRGVYITHNNENKLVKGLIDFIVKNADKEIDPKQVIALVMVNKDGKLIDVNGDVIPEGVDVFDHIIFQVKPLSKLKWSEDFDRGTQFRKDVPQEVIDSLVEQYTKRRDSVLSSEEIGPIHTISASFGRPDFVYKRDENNDIIEKDGKKVIDYSVHTSLEDAGFIEEDDLESTMLLTIPTTNETLSKGTTMFENALGRVFLNLPDAYMLLQNRHHTKQEAEVIFQAIVQLAKEMMNPDVNIKDRDSKYNKIVDWLKSVVYWNLPAQRGEKNIGYSGMFWTKNKNGEFVLVVSELGKEFKFTPTELENNKGDIIVLLEAMYNNINHPMTKSLSEKYEEITSISKNGDIRTRTWPNYQTYLLSKKNPDGSLRKNEELPLSVPMEKAEEGKVNRHGIYFYTTDNIDDFKIPEAKKPIPIAPKKSPSTFTPKDEPTKYSVYTSKGGLKVRYAMKPGGTEWQDIVVYEGEDLTKAVAQIKSALTKEYEKMGQTLTEEQMKDETRKQLQKAIFQSLPKAKEEDEETFTVGELAKPSLKEEQPKIEEKEEQQEEKEEDDGGDTFTINDLLNDPNGPLLREKLKSEIEGNVVIENWKEIESWLKRNFPNIPVYRVRNVIQAVNGKQAWGMFKDGAIYIYENAEVGTTYHEVFEAVWKIMSSPEEQQNIIDEFRNRKGSFVDRPTGESVNYKDATAQQIKEQLAEEFRDYVQFKKIPPKPDSGKPFIVKLFADVVSFIKSFITGEKASSNVEKLFEKISTGGYRTTIPYATELSFAKKGIIDIDDAFADDEAELREVKLNDSERGEIVEHMTYLTLRDLIATDKSLFSISDIAKKKTELYTKLQSQIIGVFDNIIAQINLLVEQGVYTAAQVKKNIAGYEQKKQLVIDDWNRIQEMHEDYLMRYGIQFDEEDVLQLTDEDRSGKGDYQEATKIDNYKKMNAALKLLLSAMPRMQLKDGELKPVLSEMGFYKLIPASQAYITLMNSLYDAVNVDDMMLKLWELGKRDVNYRILYERLLKKKWVEEGFDLSNIKENHGLQLMSAFWRTFSKQNPVVMNVTILDDDNVFVGEAYLSSVANQLRYEFMSDIIAKARERSPYFEYDAKAKVFKGKKDAVKDVKLNSIDAMIAFLDRIGIQFTNAEKAELKKLPKKLKGDFEEAVSGIRKSIENADAISSFSSKSLSMHKRLAQLGEVRAFISHPDFDSTFFNVMGERTQSYIGPNAASGLYNVLKNIKNKEELRNTPYAYLLDDSFAQGSNIINRMFTSKGTRREGTENLMQIGYVSGTLNERKGRRKTSAKLTYPERLVQQINLNLKGWWQILVPADATIEWVINMGNNVSNKEDINPISIKSIRDRGLRDVHEIFKGYVISEIELAREDRDVEKGRNAKDLRFFSEILGRELVNDILTNKEKDTTKLYNNFEDRINEAIDKYVKKKTEAFEDILREYNILKETEEGFNLVNVDINNNLTKGELNLHLTSLTVNYMIANIELHKILFSDPYQYKDELKRAKAALSPRQSIIHSSKIMNSAFHKIWNKGFKKDGIGWIKFDRDYFRTSTLSDIMGTYGLDGYTEFKITDGAGIISSKAHRNFKIRAGEWNDANEAQYKYDVVYEKKHRFGKTLSEKEQEIYDNGSPNSALIPLKPIVFGNKKTATGNNNVVIDKFALYPISYRIAREIAIAGGKTTSNLVSLYEKMDKEDVDYAVFKSGRKVGGNDQHMMYKNGEFNTDPFNNIVEIPFNIISVQTEVPSHDEYNVTRGSQVTKLVTMDFMEAGVPIDFMPSDNPKDFTNRYKAWYELKDEQEREKYSPLYKEIKHNERLLKELTQVGYEALLKNLGIRETGKGYEIDYDVASSVLRNEMLKREINDNIIDALSSLKKGQMLLEATPAYHQIRNILYSIADREVVHPKMPGAMKVQIPSIFMEEHKLEQPIEGKNIYTSKDLHFYDENDRVCEIMISRWFDSPMSDAELLEYLNNTDEGQRILRGVAYRIPTQKQNSIESFRIKQFLPKEYDAIVVPHALVQKVGSDFDIDKLSVYLKNIFRDAKGNIKLLPFVGFGKDAKNKLAWMVDDLIKEKIQITNEKIIKFEHLQELFSDIYLGKSKDKVIDKWIPIFKDWFKDDLVDGKIPIRVVENFFMRKLEDLDKKINKLTNEDVQEAMIDELSERWYKQSLENEYIESNERLISHPLNFKQLVKPNSAKQLKDLANEIVKKTGDVTFDYEKIDNMLDITFMSKLRHAFVTGKYAIGIAAVNQTNHSLNQRQPFYINRKKLNVINKEDEEWIDDAEIRFSKYNRIEIDGEMVPTLSMIKNQAGDYISDIIGQFIDGYVDISNGPWIMELGATPNVASTFLFLTKLGVPIKTVGYFMNQPIVRDYLKKIETSGYSWLFIDDFVDEIIGEYIPNIEDGELKSARKDFVIPSETTLGKSLGKKIGEMTKDERLTQVLILKEFLKYAKMAEHLFHVTQAVNYDTATFNDPYLIFKKEQQLIKARNTIFSNVDDLLNNSFISGTAKAIKGTRDPFALILKSEHPKIRRVLHDVLMPYVDVRDKDFVKIARKAVNDLFDWAVQTDQELNLMVQDILINKGGVAKELYDFVNSVKNNRKHPLHGNHVIEILSYKSSSKSNAEKSPNNISIRGVDNKVYEQNKIIYALREIRDYLGEEKDELYDRMLKLAILQSGLSNSAISFTSVIPYEDFEKIYAKTISKIETLSLGKFHDLHVFQRNNWADDEIVEHDRARTVKWGSTWKYNPAMEALPEHVKNAIADKKIPQLMTRPINSSNAQSEFIVYTWEKTLHENYQKDKQMKNEMRKKGDYSFIQKGLFQRVYDDEFGNPLLHQFVSKGVEKKYYVYKAINAWGDSYRANEFYDVPIPSKIDNGFITADESISNSQIIDVFLQMPSEKKVEGQTMSNNTQDDSMIEFNKLPEKSQIPTMTYAGVGSRQTPQHILNEMTKIARELESKGYTLNTGITFGGRKEGADYAFDKGATKKNLFSPEKHGSRNREQSIAKEIHPNPSALSLAGLKLMARNTNQVFGDNLDTPVDFVLFYAEETSNPLRPKGGTGQAIEMARRKGIPTINMANSNWRDELSAVLKAQTIPATQQTGQYYEGDITPSPNTIFVFGSNPIGINGNPTKGTGGAALIASTQFGVKQGEKMDNKLSESGNAYGLTTVTYPGRKRSMTPEQITEGVKKLYEVAKQYPNKQFKVAYRNTIKPSLNGYTGLEMIDMFNNAGNVPSNVIFSKEWVDTGRLNNISSSKQTNTIKLRDGKTYNHSDINTKMLQKMGYSFDEIGRLLQITSYKHC